MVHHWFNVSVLDSSTRHGCASPYVCNRRSSVLTILSIYGWRRFTGAWISSHSLSPPWSTAERKRRRREKSWDSPGRHGCRSLKCRERGNRCGLLPRLVHRRAIVGAFAANAPGQRWHQPLASGATSRVRRESSRLQAVLGGTKSDYWP